MSSIAASNHPHMAPPAHPAGNSQPTLPAESSPVQTTGKVLVDDGNLRAANVLVEEHYPEGTKMLADFLLLQTGEGSDTVHISQLRNGQLCANVNGKYYAFNTPVGSPKVAPYLHIRTGGGDDRITIDPNVTIQVKIEAGDGNDTVRAGSGYTSVYGGRGNDDIQLGSGTGYAEGNEGNDTIKGGSGHTVIYGNSGNDRLYAGPGPASKHSHLDGGAGDDELHAGNGHTVLNGGQGNDLMVAHDQTAVYTGAGRDIVRANANKARIYAKATDHLIGAQHSTITHVTPTEAGRQGFKILGSPRFVARVEDDLALLRASPQGQKMLDAMDKGAAKNGAPVTIVQSDDANGTYDFWSTELQKLEDTHQPRPARYDPRAGYIKEGVAGSRADRATISYNPAHAYNSPIPLLPLELLYHEMAHAWNGANGTILPDPNSPDSDSEPTEPPNIELQAVGLPTNAPPFDFDNDPSTPPTSTNPAPFNENTMNTEWGKALRTRYD